MIKIIDLRCGKDSDIFENLASRSQLEYRDVLDRVEEIVAMFGETETKPCWNIQPCLTRFSSL